MGWFRYAVPGLLLLGATSPTNAQAPITPGGVGDTLRRMPEIQPLPPLQSLGKKPLRNSFVPANTTEKTITVDRFEFAGNTLYSSNVLMALVADYNKRPITLLELYEAADKITAFYVEQGYTLASVAVPAQKVSSGSVRFEVLEGQIGELRYEGLKSYHPNTLDSYLNVVDGSVYRGSRFEEALRTVDALPGLDAKAQLRPGTVYGTSDIVVQAAEKRIEGSVFLDNAGTDSIGVFRYSAQLTINNPLRYADQLSLFGLRSRSHLGFKGEDGLLNYGSATYSVPVGFSKSRVNASYGYAEFDVQGAFTGVGGKNQNAKLELVVPVPQDTTDQMAVTASLNHTRANTDFSGTTFSESKVSTLDAGGSFSHTHANRAASQATVLVGLNIGSNNAAGISKRPARIELDLQHLMPLPAQFQFLAHSNLVYATDEMSDTQKFALGGPSSIRGYAPSEARGDWGYLAQLTLRRPMSFGRFVLIPRAFFDAGATRQHDNSQQQLSLTSAGGGFDAAFYNLSLKLDYAAPLSKTPVSDGKEDGRLYSTFSLAF